MRLPAINCAKSEKRFRDVLNLARRQNHVKKGFQGLPTQAVLNYRPAFVYDIIRCNKTPVLLLGLHKRGSDFFVCRVGGVEQCVKTGGCPRKWCS